MSSSGSDSVATERAICSGSFMGPRCAVNGALPTGAAPSSDARPLRSAPAETSPKAGVCRVAEMPSSARRSTSAFGGCGLCAVTAAANAGDGIPRRAFVLKLADSRCMPDTPSVIE